MSHARSESSSTTGVLDRARAVVQVHTVARNAEKIAISVERELLARAERLRSSTGESRSALLGRALRLLLRTEGHARQVEQYVDAYQRMPESAGDERHARAQARRSLAALDWDDA